MENIIGIYCITNLINGKKYIGQSINIYKRVMNHKKDEKNIYLKRAFEKYGIENFSFEILVKINIKDEWVQRILNFYETYFVFYYGSMYFDNGYNIKFPGNAGTHSEETRKKLSNSHIGFYPTIETRKKQSEIRTGIKLTEETKEKLRISKIGDKNPMYGKKWSQERKNERSIKLKGNTYSKGITMSQETKDKISNSLKEKKLGKENKNSRKIVCVETNKVYDTIKQASEDTNLNYGNISSCCRNNRKTVGGYHWVYYESYIINIEEMDKLPIPERS